MKTIGNDRLWAAARALVSGEKDVRHRVVVAMRIISSMHSNELCEFNDLQIRLNKLLYETGKRGPQIVNGTVEMDAYEYTAKNRCNKTYVKYAEEIFSIWFVTCDD